MNIFIMEDCLYQRRRLEKIINEIARDKKIKVAIVVATGKTENIVKKITERGRHQLFFLDTKIKKVEEKGFELAQTIRMKDPNSAIVFLTNDIKLGIKAYGYQIAALDFIEKGLKDEAFKKSIELCMTYVEQHKSQPISADAFYFSSKYTTFQLPFSDILYIETITGTHRLKVITKKSTLEFYASLKKIETIDERLFRCHRSYIANLENIISVDKRKYVLEFENNAQCYVSRRNIPYIMEYFKKVSRLS